MNYLALLPGQVPNVKENIKNNLAYAHSPRFSENKCDS